MVLISFSKFIRVRDSNKVEVLTILEALRIYGSFDKIMIVKIDLSYEISWVSQVGDTP